LQPDVDDRSISISEWRPSSSPLILASGTTENKKAQLSQ
jgi:hypothetical protein